MEFIPCCGQMNAAPHELRPLPGPPPPLPVPDDLILTKADLAAALAREPRPTSLRVTRLRAVHSEFVLGRVPLKPGQDRLGRTWEGNPNVAEYDLEEGV